MSCSHIYQLINLQIKPFSTINPLHFLMLPLFSAYWSLICILGFILESIFNAWQVTLRYILTVFTYFLTNTSRFAFKKSFNGTFVVSFNSLPIFRALLVSSTLREKHYSSSTTKTLNMHSVMRRSIKLSISSFFPGLLISTITITFLLRACKALSLGHFNGFLARFFKCVLRRLYLYSWRTSRDW